MAGEAARDDAREDATIAFAMAFILKFAESRERFEDEGDFCCGRF